MIVYIEFQKSEIFKFQQQFPLENDQVDKVKQFYENISLQVNGSLLAGDYVFLAGDMNAKVGKNLIKCDVHDMSSNGKYLFDLVQKFNLKC